MPLDTLGSYMWDFTVLSLLLWTGIVTKPINRQMKNVMQPTR